MLNVGDIVVRKSYRGDLYFRIIEINPYGMAKLVGINYRVLADAPLEDLQKIDYGGFFYYDKLNLMKVEKTTKNILKKRLQGERQRSAMAESVLKRPGKVLHLDGDLEYLKICLKYYRKLEIDVIGKNIEEKEHPKEVLSLLKKYKPDILVITGHDAISKGTKDYNNMDNYKNSKYFVEAVKKAREYKSNMDELVIFAGACQSNYEALIEAGANFASSPNRIMIHALDPVFICEKIAYTSVENVLSINEAIENTITGIKGIGGFQTRGKYREGAPDFL
ncbi:sporulation peptidase YabG [Defluviitalea phaphyphila]|uniref:sporulation peptidase YabG n=1 Tax=Defluviitalea phaphyphila TaxID=1473580 RepID=UPI000730A660|nr:sporulation peptidase YabG [Defluviitalea phaphyphila]